MYRSTLQLIRSRPRAARKAFVLLGMIGLVAGASLVHGGPASATPVPPSASDCTYSNSATAPNAAAVTGVTPGSTVTISCAAGSLPAGSLLVLAEASGLAAIVSPSSANLSETDVAGIQLVAAGADGSLHATFTVPAAFTAGDSNAACPPTQAQINVGLSCLLVTVSLTTLQPLNEAMLVYDGQGTPNAPTLRGTFTAKRGMKTITVSDKAGACPTPPTASSHCWWGAAVTGAPNPDAFGGIPAVEALVSKLHTTGTLSVSPAVYCQTGATAAACAGLPAQTLVPPALSGQVKTTTGLTPLTVNEPNATPYPGNGTLPSIFQGTVNVGAKIGTLIRQG
ncbi:MAG: hypothetical protein LBV34_12245 [Nocardiopsaceae bacterium]|nr:hypothetical protein [Nocardiopsaceae bacterium]